MLAGMAYRARQFWYALSARPGAADLELVRTLLKSQEFSLFQHMQPGEQAHSIEVMKKVQQLEQHSQRKPDPDLMAAALLHDVGKVRYPLQVWERIFIVLGKALLPHLAHQWSQGAPHGWRRAFVIAEQHPAWGAQMAEQAGSSPRTVRLILHHQTRGDGTTDPFENQLLHSLQIADSDS